MLKRLLGGARQTSAERVREANAVRAAALTQLSILAILFSV